jgi:hypothetical protein
MRPAARLACILGLRPRGIMGLVRALPAIVGGLLLALLPPSSTRACGSGDVYWCIPSAVAPSAAIIPQNAPALVYFQWLGGRNVAGDPASQVHLFDGDGRALAVEVRDDEALWVGVRGSFRHSLIHPAEALATGRYDIVHRSGCPSAMEMRTSFEVGPPAALPDAVGTVRLGTRSKGRIQYPYPDSCSIAGEGESVEIVFEPAPSLRPWLPLTRFTLVVDGKPWSSSAYGSDRAPQPSMPADGVPIFRPFSFCPQQPYCCLQPGSILPGQHQAELRAHIAGAASDPPPITFEISFDPCPRTPGADGANALPAAAPASEGGGCGVVSATGRNSGYWIALVALAAFVFGHRRMRQARDRR